jgi:hypothetical protein
MIVIQDVLISDEIIEENFKCNLSKCKGACCVEGDYGAPVSPQERVLLAELNNIILPYLPERSRALIEQNSGTVYVAEAKIWATACHDDGACVYLTKSEDGISMCGIEKAYYQGDIKFVKPLSCHLYPIRVSSNDISGFEAWNYDRWDICSAACELGDAEKLPIYKFLKGAITRAKGQDFYDELDAAATALKA